MSKRRRSKHANGEGGARFRRGRWWIRYTDQNGERREVPTTAGSQREAEAMLSDRLEAIQGTTVTTIGSLYGDLCRDYRMKSQREKDLPKRWKHLEAPFGKLRPEEMTTDLLWQYADRRMLKAKPATVHRELACLRRMLRLGAAMTPPKVRIVPIFPTLRYDNIRKNFFDYAGFCKVRDELDPHLRVVATVAYWIGWRRGEMLDLTWSQCDLKRGTITLDPWTTKNNEGRIVFVPAEALDVLRSWHRATKKLEKKLNRIIPHVFHRQGKKLIDFYDAWREACKRAGFAGARLHDFRRSTARNYRRSGVQEKVIMAVMGHKTRSMFDRYNIVDERDLEEAAKTVAAPTPPQRAAKRCK